MHRIALVRAGVPGRSAETAELQAVDGTPVAVVDQAPPLLARLTVADVRKQERVHPAPPPSVLAKAGELFTHAELAGLTPEAYCELQARATGIPISTARRGLTVLGNACADMGDRTGVERPVGASAFVGDGSLNAVWVRRGDVLAVIAPSNNPGVNTQWVHGVALGYRVVVRPGTRDPFTPARLVRNLNRGDYRDLTAGRLPYGRAMVSLQLDTSGLPTDCRVTRSSGDQYVDSGLCPLISRRLRFRPAMDAQGRPIPYRLDYVANWSL